MALTVFAEKMGFFHKGSAGIGVAPLDVCLSPPPGPVPIPYTNVLFAKDLINGSKTVRIDGEPTFLEDRSETSTSIGDEGGTLGGSVVTGVILGKGYFMVWSMTIQIEGYGVCRHGDMMGQNSASSPPSSIDAAALAQHSVVEAPIPAPVAARRAAQAEVLEATGPGDSEPALVEPCEFEKVSIECSHTGERGFGPFEYTYAGVIQDNLPRPENRPFVPTIQVVAGSTDDDADTIKIELSGGPGYGCSNSHPRVVIIDRSTGERQQHSGETSVELKAKSKALELPAYSLMGPVGVLAYFWFSSKTTRRYAITVDSCGVQADQSPGFRQLSRSLDVFSKDKYKLSCSIPAAFNNEYTGTPTRAPSPRAALGRGRGGPTDDRWDNETAYNQGSPIAKPLEELGASVQLTRNGDDLKATATLGKIVQALVKTRSEIEKFRKFIRDFQPQLGWKFGFAISLFEGDLALEWGAKEAADHTVFKWWKFEAELTLLALEIELNFGVDVHIWRIWTMTALVFGKISGAVKLATAVEATPDSPDWEAKLAGDISGELGVRGALGADWVAVEGRLEVVLPFEATPKIDGEDGFGIHYKLECDGLEAKIVGKIKFFGSFAKTYPLIDGGTITQGRFPGAAEQASE